MWTFGFELCFPSFIFYVCFYSIWAHQRILYEVPWVLLAAFSCFYLYCSWIILFKFHFLEMPIPLKRGVPLLFSTMGHKIIILFSGLLEICSSGPGWCGSVDWVLANPALKGSLVGFPVWAHAWVEGQIPSRGHSRGNHTLVFLSLSFSLPSPLSKNN